LELEIVKFIKSHENWEELLAAPPYSLAIKHDGNLVLFKYSQIDSDFHEKIVCESRGLILEKDTWKVVRLAFFKFFNLGEECAAQIDWESSLASDKIDGSLMSVFYYNGKWRLATNGTIDAFSCEVSSPTGINVTRPTSLTFGELFEQVLPLKVFDEREFNKDYCYTFELTSQYNQVVVLFDKPELHLISVRDLSKDGYPEFEYPQVALPDGVVHDYHIQIPTNYKLNSLNSYKELVAAMGEGNEVKEGIVVRDKYFNRVKIKTLKYLELHYKYAGVIITLEKLLGFIIANEVNEFLAYYPNYETAIIRIENRMKNVKRFAEMADGLDFYCLYSHECDSDLSEDDYNSLPEKQKRKMFAEYISRHFDDQPYYKALLFKGWDKHAVETVANWGIPQWTKYIKYTMEETNNDK